MKHSKIFSVLITLIISICSLQVSAQFAPSKLFASGMVLQRNLPIPIWGIAGAEDSVIITFNSITDTAFADTYGNWKVTFPAMIEGGPYSMEMKCKAFTKSLNTIYIGDVWVCSGQSNMEYMVSQANNSATTIANANSETIRQFKISKALSTTPDSVLNSGTWTPATTANVGSFSAAAYYFARDIQPEIGNVPIGIINVSYGGSRIETWMSKEMLGYDENDIKLAAGEAERQPTLAFNRMINPIVGLPIKGFLWYQGESNADNMDDALVYSEQFPKLIKGWRELWGMGDLPFIWVQLPNEGTIYSESTPQTFDAWPQLRAAQSRALSLPNTGEAVIIDLGEVDIHPKEKEGVGARLALVARKIAYGQSIVYNGPRYKSHNLLPDGSVQIEFDNIGGGLQAKDSTNGKLHWFVMAGSNGILKPANAVISGNSVIVSNSTITEPAIVRYAWEFNPVGANFYNAENLPACPFKIDVVNPGFKINSFTSSSLTIERGQFINLSWKTSGNAITTFNGVVVDSISADRLMPLDTIQYILKIVDKNDANITDSDTITINVTNPKPTIKLSNANGNVSPPNEALTFVADAKAPGGGTVDRVEFFVDDVLIYTDSEAPYEFVWTPTEIATYIVKGLVINNLEDSTYSIPFTMYINNLTRVRYEAELATITGDGSVKPYSIASNRKIVQLQQNWTLTFNNITVDTAGTYQMNIKYICNYESPKEEDLYINGVKVKTIRFEAPNNSTMMDIGMQIHLNAGTNIIELKTSWGWISFDYIDILGANPINSIAHISTSNASLQVIKEPNSGTKVSYTLPKSGNIKLEILDVTGKSVETLAYGYQQKGTFIANVKQNLIPGVYIIKLTANKEVTSLQCVIP